MAIFIEIGSNALRNVAQHSGRPQVPYPPISLASSRTPIWWSWTLVLSAPATSFTRSRKSILPVSGERERDLGAIEGKLGLKQLHRELVLGDLALADLIGVRLALAIGGLAFEIVAGGKPNDLLERGDQFLVGQVPWFEHDLAELHAPRGLGYDEVTLVELELARVEVVDLAYPSEGNAHNKRHV